MKAPGEDAEHDSDEGAESRLAEQRQCLGPRVRPRPGENDEEEDEREGEAVVSPDSRLSVCRTDGGTRRDVTITEVTTGSVGESTAASRNASAHVSPLITVWAASPSTPIVSGIAITIARTTGCQ
jgi:hypothetical protein